MTFTVGPMGVLYALPWILAFLFSFLRNNASSGFLGISDRVVHYIVSIPVCIFIDVVIGLFYWMGKAKGWWD